MTKLTAMLYSEWIFDALILLNLHNRWLNRQTKRIQGAQTSALKHLLVYLKKRGCR